jgi:DNA-binding CsgD family transcriptional regulator
MSCQEFVQPRHPATPAEMRPSSARDASRSLPASSYGVPAPRASVEDVAGARVSDVAVPLGGPPPFSARDLELLRHLADGRSTGQIAAAMAVTSNTTRTRLRRVQRKLATARREQVVAAARQFGVV